MPVIKTYTRIWRTDRMIYSIQDWVLPTPISLVGGVVFLSTFVPLMFLAMVVLKLPLVNVWTMLLVLGIPTLTTFIAMKARFEEKSLVEYFSTQLNFLTTPKEFVDLQPVDTNTPDYYIVRQEIWSPHAELTAREREKAKRTLAKREEIKNKNIRKAKKTPKKLYKKGGK